MNCGRHQGRIHSVARACHIPRRDHIPCLRQVGRR
nr:MAG TPA: hypothetical protein [Bacteriophage sp.]